MADRKNIIYITIAQSIGCLLVLYGHSYPTNVEIPMALVYLRNFIYDFHMPLFVFMSGFLVVTIDSINKYGQAAYIKKRALKLLIPYFALSIIGFIPKYFASDYVANKFDLSLPYLLRMMFVPKDNIWAHLWYIPMLFGLTVMSLIFVKILRKSRAWFYILFAVSFLIIFIPPVTDWFSVNDIKNFMFYYVFGMVLAHLISTSQEFFAKKWYVVLFPAAIAVFIIGVKFAEIAVIADLTGALVAVCMILFTLWLTYSLMNRIKVFGIFSENTFSIYILSWPAQVIVKKILFSLIAGLNVYIEIVILFAVGLLFPLAVIQTVKFIERKTPIKFLSILIGK